MRRHKCHGFSLFCAGLPEKDKRQRLLLTNLLTSILIWSSLRQHWHQRGVSCYITVNNDSWQTNGNALQSLHAAFSHTASRWIKHFHMQIIFRRQKSGRRARLAHIVYWRVQPQSSSRLHSDVVVVVAKVKGRHDVQKSTPPTAINAPYTRTETAWVKWRKKKLYNARRFTGIFFPCTKSVISMVLAYFCSLSVFVFLLVIICN